MRPAPSFRRPLSGNSAGRFRIRYMAVLSDGIDSHPYKINRRYQRARYYHKARNFGEIPVFTARKVFPVRLVSLLTDGAAQRIEFPRKPRICKAYVAVVGARLDLRRSRDDDRGWNRQYFRPIRRHPEPVTLRHVIQSDPHCAILREGKLPFGAALFGLRDQLDGSVPVLGIQKAPVMRVPDGDQRLVE